MVRSVVVLVCDMKMKGSYKLLVDAIILPQLVCDMKMKGSYKLLALIDSLTNLYVI